MRKLILASASPRRKELLSSLGFQFETWIKDIDESCPDFVALNERALWVATRKSEAWRSELKKNEILISADTIVVLADKVLNKPQTKEEACHMLMELSGRTHNVITGIVVESDEKIIQSTVITEVTFRTIPLKDIVHYLDTYKPYDKAGSYGIQEWIGHAFVKEIRGSYNNVVGLPTDEIYDILVRKFNFQ